MVYLPGFRINRQKENLRLTGHSRRPARLCPFQAYVFRSWFCSSLLFCVAGRRLNSGVRLEKFRKRRMGIPILGEIEKLINEHGSAAILKERLTLAADQFRILESKNAESQAKIIALEQSDNNLRSDLQKAHQEIGRLNNIILEYHKFSLSEKHEKVLLAVAIKSGRDAFTLAEYAELTEPETLEKLSYLSTKNFVIGSFSSPKTWTVMPEGHRYLSVKKLIDKII